MSDEYPEVTLLLRHWSNGGSALPAVKTLVECGYKELNKELDRVGVPRV